MHKYDIYDTFLDFGLTTSRAGPTHACLLESEINLIGSHKITSFIIHAIAIPSSNAGEQTS